MNRRHLLATVAAIPMSGILPPQTFAEASDVLPTPISEPASLNVCAATARRIEEIIARNRIRAEACLPLPSIPKELRRMKEVAIAAKFEAFTNSHRGAVWDEVLATKREARGEPNWHPSGWMEGWRFSQRSVEFFDNGLMQDIAEGDRKGGSLSRGGGRGRHGQGIGAYFCRSRLRAYVGLAFRS
jgi:hypothetical protein